MMLIVKIRERWKGGGGQEEGTKMGDGLIEPNSARIKIRHECLSGKLFLGENVEGWRRGGRERGRQTS